jgi:hypothetical protein
MKRIVIDMSGGLIQAVFSDEPELEIVVIDWDDPDAAGYEPEEYDPTEDMHKLIHEPVAEPLSQMPADDVAALQTWDAYQTR